MRRTGKIVGYVDYRILLNFSSVCNDGGSTNSIFPKGKYESLNYKNCSSKSPSNRKNQAYCKRAQHHQTSIKKAQANGIETSLLFEPNYAVKRVFNDREENRSENYECLAAKMHYRLTSKDLRQMAYEMVIIITISQFLKPCVPTK